MPTADHSRFVSVCEDDKFCLLSSGWCNATQCLTTWSAGQLCYECTAVKCEAMPRHAALHCFLM